MAAGADDRGPGAGTSNRPGDSIAIEHQTVDRLANLVVTVVPLALLGFAIFLAWGNALHWPDLVVLATSYVLTGVGITVGFHRLFTHRSLKTNRLLRALFAVLGSAAVEGPVIEWVSSHRKHHIPHLRPPRRRPIDTMSDVRAVCAHPRAGKRTCSTPMRRVFVGAFVLLLVLPAQGRALVRTPNPCEVARLHLRCPALVMSAPFELHLDRTTFPGRVLLRASSSIDNHGSGPLELRAHRVGVRATVVYQAIYGRGGRAHLYRTDARLIFKYIPGNRYEYGNVGGASYWKLQHAAAFQLWSIDRHFRAVRQVRTGPKVDYCLRDLLRTHPSRNSPSEPVYPGCSQNPSMHRDVLGTSVGWSDVYPYAYPEQWIDVTGLHGRFAYVQIVDPDHLLFDSNPKRRVSETYVELPSGRVLGHRVGVATP